MAMEDYLSGSPFGQVAGSLLRRRDRDWRKALGISVLGSVLQGMNLQKQSENQKNIERTTEEYDQIFSNNDEIWAAKEQERSLWRGYQSATRRGEAAKEDWIDRQAMNRFDDDAFVRREMGANAYQSLQGDKWTQETKDQALGVFQNIRGQIVDEISSFREDKAITAPTQTKFNQAAYDELNAQLAIYEDDPSKQSVILNTFGNIFGTYDRKRAELAGSLREAQRTRREQEATYEGVSYDTNNQIIVEQISSVMKNDVGLADWQTREEVIAQEQRAIRKKMQSPGYGDRENPVTEEDMRESLRLGINPLQIPHVDAITAYNREQVVKVFSIANEVNRYHPDEQISNYLEGSDLVLYDTLMGTDSEGRGLKLTEAVADEYKRYAAVEMILENIGDPDEVPRGPAEEGALEDPRRLLSLIEGDFKIDSETQIEDSTGQSKFFVIHMLQAAEILEKKYYMEPQEALAYAYELQLKGINPEASTAEEKVAPTWIGKGIAGLTGAGIGWDKNYRTHKVDFVNPDAMSIITNIIPATAHRAARYMTTEGWMHRSMEYEDEGNMYSFEPGEGKSFTMPRDEGEDFEITFTSEPNVRPGQTQKSWDDLENGSRWKTYRWKSSVSYTDE